MMAKGLNLTYENLCGITGFTGNCVGDFRHIMGKLYQTRLGHRKVIIPSGHHFSLLAGLADWRPVFLYLMMIPFSPWDLLKVLITPKQLLVPPLTPLSLNANGRNVGHTTRQALPLFGLGYCPYFS